MPPRKTAQNDPQKRKLKAKQAAFLKSFVDCNFNVSKACRDSGVARRTLYSWREDKEFSEKMDEAVEAKLDNLEQALYDRALDQSDSCLIFLAKCLLRGRGYVEGREQGGKLVAELLSQVLRGDLTAREAAFKINGAGVPLPEVLRIELSKALAEEEDHLEPVSVEELEARAEQAMSHYNNEVGTFVPQRRAEVAVIKEELKHTDSFALATPTKKGE